MLLIKLKFSMFIIHRRYSYYINFGMHRRYSFLQNQNFIYYYLRITKFEVYFSIVKLFESIQNWCEIYCFHYVCTSMEIMCIALIVFCLENIKLFYFFKYLIISSYPESWMESLLILTKSLPVFIFFFQKCEF